ncbi:MAG: group II intron maturase-specific domain-containing protein [Dehalococcoidia bacterium]
MDGWARYHAFGASKQTFNSVDHAIHKKLWWWIKRRHPGKSPTWRKAKYFPPRGPDNWRFAGDVRGQDGVPFRVYLHRAADMPIKRHVAIRKEANPFDPAWEPYVEARLDLTMECNLRGKRRLLALWKDQGGVCPHCGHRITKLTGWHSHHVVWRSKGGGDGCENRVLLHPTCHMQVHSRGIALVKPPRARGVRKA